MCVSSGPIGLALGTVLGNLGCCEDAPLGSGLGSGYVPPATTSECGHRVGSGISGKSDFDFGFCSFSGNSG